MKGVLELVSKGLPLQEVITHLLDGLRGREKEQSSYHKVSNKISRNPVGSLANVVHCRIGNPAADSSSNGTWRWINAITSLFC